MTTGAFSPVSFVLGSVVTVAAISGARSSLRRLRADPDVQFEPRFIGFTTAFVVAILTGIGLLAAAFLDFGS